MDELDCVLELRTTQSERHLPFVLLGDLFERVTEQVLASLPEPPVGPLKGLLVRGVLGMSGARLARAVLGRSSFVRFGAPVTTGELSL
jgi:hypothetical protein